MFSIGYSRALSMHASFGPIALQITTGIREVLPYVYRPSRSTQGAPTRVGELLLGSCRLVGCR